MTAPATFAEIRDEFGYKSFPHDALIGCQTALILFAAGFYGKQDAFWIADAGLHGTCVDVDESKLLEMRAVYPADWIFVTADAYKFAERAAVIGGRLERKLGATEFSSVGAWDVVTLDPFTHDFTKCADNIEAWCRLARSAVILGTGRETLVTQPPGWKVSEVRRRSDYAGGVFWTLLERV